MYRSAVFHPRFLSGMDSVIWNKYIQPLQEIGLVTLTESVPWQRSCIRNFYACWNVMEREPLGFEVHAREALMQITLLLYAHLDIGRQKASLREQRNSQRTKTMLSFIQSHYAGPLTTARIAAFWMQRILRKFSGNKWGVHRENIRRYTAKNRDGKSRLFFVLRRKIVPRGEDCHVGKRIATQSVAVLSRSMLPLRSVLDVCHWHTAPEPAGETKSFCPCHRRNARNRSRMQVLAFLFFKFVLRHGLMFGVIVPVLRFIFASVAIRF